jgi:hypothetical protein
MERDMLQTLVERGLRIDALEAEVKYLRYYVKNVQPCLGPGDGDINNSIGEEFVREFGVDALPTEERQYYLERQDARRKEG